MSKLSRPNYPEGYDPFVRALIQLSNQVKTYSPPTLGPANRTGDDQTVDTSKLRWVDHQQIGNEAAPADYEIPTVPTISTFHAEPLSPLRHRDETALNVIFDDDQIDQKIADVQTRLNQLFPEPCWETEPYEFLKGYL